MITVGLDLSLNSTGICIHDTVTDKYIYYIIGSKFTQKALKYRNSNLNFIQYPKTPINTHDEYHVKEEAKTNNIYNIIRQLKDILNQYKPEIATIEGVSFQSSGSVLDLCGLNYMVRMVLKEEGIKHIYIVSPTQNKKFATGNGQAEKDVMISAWHKLNPIMTNIPTYIKVDDIADAYFLTRYGESLLSS